MSRARPGLVEHWYISDGDLVSRQVGEGVPTLQMSVSTDGLFRALRRAGVVSHTGETVCVRLTHGHPPRLAYRSSEAGPLTPCLSNDPVAGVFMEWYRGWLVDHIRTRGVSAPA